MSTMTYTSTNARPCASCGSSRGWCLDTCLDNEVDWFFQGPQKSVKMATTRPRAPRWATISIVVGLALIGLGIVLNEPVSWMVYDLIPR